MYTVYNVTSSDRPIVSPHPIEDIVDLYKLLLDSPEVVNVEQHVSADRCRSELRVIFWNQDAYYNFANTQQEKYQDIVNRLNKNFAGQPVEFFRNTSEENYSSEFAETYYPPACAVISWTLVIYLKNWFIKNILPLGKCLDYVGDGKFQSAPVVATRFKKDRTGSIVRRRPDQRTMNTFPDFISYNFESALEVAAIRKQPYIYHRFMQLSEDVERFAEEYVVDCDNAAILVGHESVGNGISLHTHRLTEQKHYTFTVITRITFNDDPILYQFYKPLEDTDPYLYEYYRNIPLLEKTVGSTVPNAFSSTARASVLVFNGSYIPHTVNYNQDLYLFFVYDNVTFKPGMFDKVKQQAQINLFEDQDENLRLYFFDIKN